MIINKGKIKIAFTDILFFVCAVLYFIGIRYWFPVCNAMGDMVMSCHWAGEVLSALSILLVAMSAVHAAIPDERIKAGVDISTLGTAVFAALVPGNIISICKNSEMPCRSGAALWTTIFMVLLGIIVCADAFIYLQSLSGKKHSRKASEKSV